MSKKLEHMIVAFTLGIFIGIFMSLGNRYNFEVNKLQKYETFCGKGETITKIKIGISGEIYSITCSNNIEVKTR